MGLQVSPQAGVVKETTTTLQNAAVATGNGTALTIVAGDVLYVTTLGADTPSSTITYEWSDDAGVSYVQAALEDTLAAAGVATRILTTAVSTTKARLRWVAPPGANRFRARVSGYVSGNVTVVAIAQSRV